MSDKKLTKLEISYLEKVGFPVMPKSYLGDGANASEKRSKWYDTILKKKSGITNYQAQMYFYGLYEINEDIARSKKKKFIPIKNLKLRVEQPEEAENEQPEEKEQPNEENKCPDFLIGLVDNDSESESDCEIDEEELKEPPKKKKTKKKNQSAAQKIKTPSRKKKDAYINLKETFNADKLKYILDNKAKCQIKQRAAENSESRMKYLQSIFGGDYDPYLMAKKYLNNSKNGKINVSYKQNGSLGRFHAVKGLSQQGMPFEIRHTIGGEHYDDIDIKNCHPVILAHLCKDRGINASQLNKYIAKRDTYLKMCGGKNTAKQVILSLMNGGYIAYKEFDEETYPKGKLWLKKFRKEMKNIHLEFAKDEQFKKHKEARIADKNDFNNEASYMNIILCDFENTILMGIYNFLESPKDCVLCFDGLQIKKGTKYDLQEIETHIKDLLNIKIKLAVKKMDCVFDIPDELEPHIDYVKPASFDFDNEYSYREFQDEFRECVFNSYDELDEVVSKKYHLVLSKIVGGKGSYAKKGDDGEIFIVDNFGSSGFDMYYINDCNIKIKITLTNYLRKQSGFSKLECRLENPDTRNFNLWSGFQAKTEEKLNDGQIEGLELMKKFLFEVWANENEEYYKYIISWFAGVVKTGKINGVAMVLISEQGTGKGFFLNFMRYLIRNVNMSEVVGINSITQKHNTIMERKRLIIVNEMSSTRDEFKSNFDKIKVYITDPYITIEPKNINPYQIENISNIILCSNHEDSIVVERSDRRYSIFQVSDKYLNNEKYFKNLSNKCFNQEVANAFYTYLLNYDCLESLKPIDTILRTQAINLSKPTPIKFIDYLKENPIMNDTHNPDEDGEPVIELKGSILYTKFREWCVENGERNICSNTKFGMAVKNILVKKRRKWGMCYVLPTAISQ